MNNDNKNSDKVNSGGNNQRLKVDLLVHDLKTPLTVIELGITSLLKKVKKYGALTDMQEKILCRALRNAKITQRLVNDVLEVGKTCNGVFRFTEVKVSTLIIEVLGELFDLIDETYCGDFNESPNLVALKKSLDEKGLVLRIEENLWAEKIHLDEVKIKQILRNLLFNAFKYRKKQVELKFDKDNKGLVFTVIDDGDGIPPCFHKQIFDSYFQIDNPSDRQNSVRGHGLGLTGVLVLVKEMGGDLALESDVGQGAKFIVKLPLGTRPHCNY